MTRGPACGALGTPFSDHLVLQRDQPNPIWGWDEPGQLVTLEVRGASVVLRAQARAAADGRFELVCPALAAGGPYTLHIHGKSTWTLSDVLVGEVWLASGQSNMEWPVYSSDAPDGEISAAELATIRMLKLERRAANEPAALAEGSWVVSTPDSVGSFSAVGYFFARELAQKVGVPVGIIDATWGGTSIEAWTSLEALRGVDATVDARRAELLGVEAELPRLRAAYEAVLAAWEKTAFPADPPNLGEALGYAAEGFDDTAWPSMMLPKFWQAHGMAFNGVVWFRKSVVLPDDWAGRELVLELGAIDDFDHTYWNGALVGAHPDGTANAFQIQRSYRVPGSQVRAGRNLLGVRVFDHFGQGGFAGPRSALCVRLADEPSARIPLDGAFRYQVEHAIPLVSADVFKTYPAPPAALVPQNVPAALHHGMLAPLVPYGLRGVIWYQGENDVGRHATYRDAMLALIRDLRTRWAKRLPFYFVQLANFRAGPEWAELRAAQAAATTEPDTGMAVAIDIGDPSDIHPKNKQEVARRLSLIARAKTYGESSLEHSGPVFESARLEGKSVLVHFRHARGLASRHPKALRGFELAGADGVFHAAEALIAGDAVRLDSPLVPEPRVLRYAWADDPEADLENGAGLPAAPFRSSELTRAVLGRAP